MSGKKSGTCMRNLSWPYSLPKQSVRDYCFAYTRSSIVGCALAARPSEDQLALCEVPEDVITSIGLLYGPILAVLSLASIAMLYFYRIDRNTHLANLAELGRRASND